MQIKQIEGFENYFVTTEGEVYRKYKKSMKKLKPYLGGSNNPNFPKGKYPVVTLYADNVKSRHYVHRLVLGAFVGPKPIGLESCHNNGVREDNRLENLRYDTPKANAADRKKHNCT